MTRILARTRLSVPWMAAVVAVATTRGAAQTPPPAIAKDSTATLVGIVVRKGTIAGVRAATLTLASSGRLLGVTDDSGYVVVSRLPTGDVDIVVRARSYVPLAKQLHLKPGVIDTVEFELAPAPSRPPLDVFGQTRRPGKHAFTPETSDQRPET